MAIMWDAAVPAAPREETPAELIWRLHFAQVLAASGFEPAIIREVLVPNDAPVRDCAVPGALDDIA